MKLFYKYAQMIPVFILAVFMVSCGDDDDDDELPQVVAGFTQTIDENTGTVTFINTSENADTYLWDFGDSTTSTEINPVKTYVNGDYTVVLTASNGAGASATFEDTFTILIPEIASLPITFDAANTVYEPEVFNGASFEVVANPDESGTNDKSGNVGAITNSGAAFEGIAFNLGTAVNLTNGNAIEMNFWANAAVDVLLKLEITETNAIETTASHGGTGWETISFDFPSSETYPKLVLFVDGPGTTDGTFYIDDVAQAGVIGAVPIITLEGDPTIEVVLGETFTDPGVTATDAEDGDITSSVVVSGDAVDVNVAGTYIINYNVTDSDGNAAAEVTRTVIVAVDETPPVITLVGPATIDLNVGDMYTEEGATATDNIDGDISADIVVGGDVVDTNTDGTYVVTYNVSDAAGNAADEVTRTVNVTTPNPFCNTQIQAFGGDAGSDILISVFNVDAQTMRIEIESADGDPVDGLVFPAGDWNPVPGISSAPADQGGGVWAGEFFYGAGAPENVEFNILWSKASFPGNWSQNESPNLSTVRFDATCDTSGGGGGGGTCTETMLQLPIDFDCESTTYNFVTFNGASYQVIDNPELSGINAVASKVGEIVNIGAAFEGGSFTLDTQLDLATDKTVTMKVYSTVALPVLLKLESGTGPDTELTANHTGAGWEQLSWEFTSSDAFSVVTLFMDGPGTTAGTFYMDDIEQVAGGGGGSECALPVDFEDCEAFLDTFGDGASIVTAEIVANPDASGINTSNSVLKVDKPTGTISFSGVQNQFEANAFGDLTSRAFKVKIYSSLPNITFRFEAALVPQTDPATGNPAPVLVTVPNANEWTEVTVQFINLPAPTVYNLLVIKPDNPGSRSDIDPVPTGGIYYFDDIRIE
ncbi:MAG: immunoglobulin-like domain-containing protein [Bacteroidota bacterium]